MNKNKLKLPLKKRKKMLQRSRVHKNKRVFQI